MKKLTLFIVAASLLSAPTLFAKSLSSAQKNEVTQLIEETLQNKPELIVKSIVSFRQQQMQKAQTEAQQLVNQHASTIFIAKDMPVLGNAKGDATVVEFLDYQCHHCKDMSSVVEQLIKKDSNVRVVVRELPIFGGQSTVAAKAALAANRQGNFAAMHKALFDLTPPLNHDSIIAAAKKAGLDTQQLEKDMASEAVEAKLKANFALAKRLNIMATPTFIVGNANSNNNVYAPGGMSVAALQQLVDKVRS